MKTKIQKGSKCLVILKDEFDDDIIKEGEIVDAHGGFVKVKCRYYFLFIKWYVSKWYPIKGEDCRVDFKSIE